MKNNKKNTNKNKTKRILLTIILFILIVILIISVYKIITWYNENQKVAKLSEDLINKTEITTVKNDGEKVNPPKDEFDPYWDFIDIPLISVNFSELIKENNDTVGWIFVDNTNINYPVVQTTNNDYYLWHSFDKKYTDAGWIYMDYRNDSKEFDNNTIIYGHSRIDRSMFGTLRNATKKEWFNNKDNHIIKFSTPYENTMWQVFSSYTIEEETYYLKTKFSNTEDYSKWLNDMKKRSKFNYSTSVDTNDKIFTLSSCYTADGIRVAVHAKLIKREVR